MKKSIVIAFLLIPFLCAEQLFAFCGFYVAKAEANLFNKSSQVIIARNGNNTSITMSNDFSGDVKDFAMIVPVPVILKESDIRIKEQSLFKQLDDYSGPRLVEYFDQNPCYPNHYKVPLMESAMQLDEMVVTSMKSRAKKEKDYKVKIEAQYTIGEYDILLLSAEESDGLERWLVDNNYKIPKQAKEVLEPYIKSDMKFFVVKVNLQKKQKSDFETLRPIQISFASPKFGLPIRLGMANAENTQDLIVYVLTTTGRVEVSNYRTVKIPTDINIPEFVSDDFGGFYKSLFDKSYEREYRNAVFLEYAWDLSATNPVKCDPCPNSPPIYNYQTLHDAGVDWINKTSNWNGPSNYVGNVFFTRLHVRYDRKNFPQDLVFFETPNKQRFQGRYVMQKALKEKVNCEQALPYYEKVAKRRGEEMETLADLTTWKVEEYDFYAGEYDVLAKKERYRLKQSVKKGSLQGFGAWNGLISLALGIGLLLAFGFGNWKKVLALKKE